MIFQYEDISCSIIIIDCLDFQIRDIDAKYGGFCLKYY
jgi:hypothetical protein